MCSVNKDNEIKLSNEDFNAYIQAASFGHLFPYSISGMMSADNIKQVKDKMDRVLNSK